MKKIFFIIASVLCFTVITSCNPDKDDPITEEQKPTTKGLKFEIEENFVSNKFEGLSFVVSGTFEGYSREALKKTIEDNSGKILSGVSAKVDYLVAGDKMGPEKKRKAEKLGVKIISEQEFDIMING